MNCTCGKKLGPHSFSCPLDRYETATAEPVDVWGLVCSCGLVTAMTDERRHAMESVGKPPACKCGSADFTWSPGTIHVTLPGQGVAEHKPRPEPSTEELFRAATMIQRHAVGSPAFSRGDTITMVSCLSMFRHRVSGASTESPAAKGAERNPTSACPTSMT